MYFLRLHSQITTCFSKKEILKRERNTSPFKLCETKNSFVCILSEYYYSAEKKKKSKRKTRISLQTNVIFFL